MRELFEAYLDVIVELVLMMIIVNTFLIIGNMLF